MGFDLELSFASPKQSITTKATKINKLARKAHVRDAQLEHLIDSKITHPEEIVTSTDEDGKKMTIQNREFMTWSRKALLAVIDKMSASQA